MAIFSICRDRIRATTLALMTITLFCNPGYAIIPVQGNDDLKQTSIEIVNQLKLNHYRYISIDNDFSSQLLDKYLDQLDPGKAYLLNQDIKEFQNYRYSLDNALNKGNLEPAFVIFNRYQQRVEERLNWVINQLSENGVNQFDFSRDETLELDREQASWADSPQSLEQLWSKRIKNAVLNLKLADKPLEDITELLLKRYKNQLNRLNQTNIEDAFQLYMNIVAKSYDPHTEYFAPRRSENFNINMSLSLEGIGAVLQSDQEFTKIVRLVPGGPADLTKELKPADRIIGVAQDDKPMVDVVGWRLDEVVDLIRGPKGTTVRLELMSKDSENQQSREISIVRNKVLLEEQAAQKKVLEIDSNGEQIKIGVIDIPTFYADFAAYQAGDPNYKSSTRDVKRLLKELEQEKVDGVIIDLRNNGGGSLGEANALTGLFIKTGQTVQVKNARDQVKILKDGDPEVAYDGPLAVMVNRLSASASEIFAGAIQDYQRGPIIGGQTFGKGTVQTLSPLKQGQLKITQAKFYRISGESTQHKGVIPDIQLPTIIDVNEIGEDALKDALPWDSIRPVLYKKVGNTQLLLDEIKGLHLTRVQSSPDFLYRISQIERVEKIRNKTTISLNELARIKEQTESRQWRLDTENKRRLAKGLEPINSLDDLEEPEEDDPADPYLIESSHILHDYITLNNRQIARH